MPDSAIDGFLRTLYGDSAGFVEIRGQNPQDGRGLAYREWFQYPNEIAAIFPAIRPHIGKINLWYGVGLRKSRGVGTKADVGCLPGIWLDVDFRTTPQEQAVLALRSFPIRASAGVASGGGLHVYYMTKEPIFASKFALAEATMKALAKAIGADTQACHADMCLRLPNTLNVKYFPPSEVKIVVGPHPDRRCNLEDFGKYLNIEVPTAQSVSGLRREVPGRTISNELVQRMAETLTGVWIAGYRHRLSLLTAGVMAHAGFSEASAVRVIETVCSMSGDDLEKPDRVAAVRDTYAKYVSGQPVAGQPTLEAMIEDLPPGVIRDRARKLYGDVKKMIPKRTHQSDVVANFEIVKIEKFTSTPARYRVTFRYKPNENEGQEYMVTCETPTIININLFRQAAFEATPNLVLSHVTQLTWERMLQQAPLEIKSAPEEASTAGAIKMELANFVDDAKPNPEYGELSTFCGYDDKHKFFVLSTFKRYLGEKGQKVSDREVIHVLKDCGWEPEKRRWGTKTVRLWVQDISDGRPTQEPQDMFGAIPPQHQQKET